MLYRENDEYKLMPLVATYRQGGETQEQYEITEEHLRGHEAMGTITDLTFKAAKYPADMLDRLDEVKSYPEDQLQVVHEYVLNNVVTEGTSLDIKKQNSLLEMSILELTSLLAGGL